ncbi:hypothetical protein B0H11DRAFT_2405774 [Mycena galericulata]|nr:hypothetical protein B0H11DRAFT_2405774 [Mycena galericulata]
MFNNSAGFQFRGGNFYNVAGDVHLQTHRHLTIQSCNQQEAVLQLPAGSPMALDDGLPEASGHELSGTARNWCLPGPAPYDFSFRPRLPASSSDLEEDSGPISSPSSSSIPHYPIPQVTREFNCPANSTSASPSFTDPEGFTMPLPNVSDPAPAHKSTWVGAVAEPGKNSRL